MIYFADKYDDKNEINWTRQKCQPNWQKKNHTFCDLITRKKKHGHTRTYTWNVHICGGESELQPAIIKTKKSENVDRLAEKCNTSQERCSEEDVV